MENLYTKKKSKEKKINESEENEMEFVFEVRVEYNNDKINDFIESIIDELKEEYTEYCFYEVEKGEKEPTFVEWYDKNIDIHRYLKTVDFKFPGVDYSNSYRYTSELCDESLETLASLVDTYIRHMQQ